MQDLEWYTPRDCEAAACAEVALLPTGGVAIRTSTDPTTVVTLTDEEYAAFVGAVRSGAWRRAG